MLTGLVPIVPVGHAFHDFIDDSCGFICKSFEDFPRACVKLQNDPELRINMGLKARERIVREMDIDRHVGLWKGVFGV